MKTLQFFFIKSDRLVVPAPKCRHNETMITLAKQVLINLNSHSCSGYNFWLIS